VPAKPSSEQITSVISKTVKVQHRLGLHARPAADFVSLANTFRSEITLRKGHAKANGKSIMGILTLEIVARSHVTVEAEGVDALAAVQVLTALLEGDV
jgi:phosphotransferase system HPr (HPr) family protein